MTLRTLLIVGAGGHGKAVAEAALMAGDWHSVEFADDRWPELREVAGWPVVCVIAGLSTRQSVVQGAIAAIGNNAARERSVQAIIDACVPLVSVVHPSAWISPTAVLGSGAAVMACAVVGTDAHVGIASIINANATVDHDAVVGDFAHLGVGVQLAGGVKIGARAWVQAGSCAGYGLVVHERTVVGPGTALVAH